MEYYESKTGHRAYFAEDHEGVPLLRDLNEQYYRHRLDNIFTTLGLKERRLTIDLATQRAAEKEVLAFLQGHYGVCPMCHGLGWRFEGRGKITVVDCTCDEGKVLVTA
jgi:hypothetical protein